MAKKQNATDPAQGLPPEGDGQQPEQTGADQNTPPEGDVATQPEAPTEAAAPVLPPDGNPDPPADPNPTPATDPVPPAEPVESDSVRREPPEDYSACYLDQDYDGFVNGCNVTLKKDTKLSGGNFIRQLYREGILMRFV